MQRRVPRVMVFVLWLAGWAGAWGQQPQSQQEAGQAVSTGAPEARGPAFPGPLGKAVKSVSIPRISKGVTLSEFEGMEPHGIAKEMAAIRDFTMRNPTNGAKPSQRTEVYLGQDGKSLYVVWLCFDSDARGVRAHVTRRENIYKDDFVQVILDTFHDQRHALVFGVNPLGVQEDGLWTEGNSGNNPDDSWDTVWNSEGKLTPNGYMVLEEIPFRSLRFKGQSGEPWGVLLYRSIPRVSEEDVWPFISQQTNGWLNQEGIASGFQGLESGKNIQLNPYAEARSFHALDTRDPVTPTYSNEKFRGKVGLDSKIVLHESLVLDATVNPDFAQVESDDPQNTVNQRFEVFFPEKRPFFLENSNFFQVQGSSGFGNVASTQLLFTRRIADPQFGARLTGKEGPWTLGFLVADDRSPGEKVVPGDPDFGKRAEFVIARVTHDVGKNSSIGAIFTTREFGNFFNRVGGVDGNWKISKNWNTSFHSVVSSTRTRDAGYSFGQDHEMEADGSGLHFQENFSYQDITPGFETQTGFAPRTDIRHVQNYYHYYFKPKKGSLALHGPEISVERIWDHTNTGIEYNFNGDWAFLWKNNTVFAPVFGFESDTLRPQDFTGLPRNKKFMQDFGGIVLRTQPNKYLSTTTNFTRGGTVDVVVPQGQLPTTADETSLRQTITVNPMSKLVIDNTYIWDRVDRNRLHASAFNNHIIRSKWNYQFNRELSVRVIAQYNGLLANQNFSSLTTTKAMNFDFLLTYLVHPGTAIYVGYNSNLENIDPGLCVWVGGVCDPNGIGLVHDPRGRLLNDGRQVFVKVAYLWRR